ncbi:(2Fe-2S)-binding protein [Rhodopirellula baltica]
MKPDDKLCLCFHVPRRKVEQFIRVEKPRRVSELSQCFGAGTGCGWCRPFLQRLFDSTAPNAESLPAPEQYQNDRKEYRRKQAEEG